MNALVWSANILGWPIVQLSIARLSLRLPLESFAADSRLHEPLPWERNGRIYRERLGIRRWKGLLPDGASWFGGFSKKQLPSRDPEYLKTFLLETRRAEFAHWCMLFCFPVFFLWNPPWACGVMFMYAVLANLPFILVQRYNRIVLGRICESSRMKGKAGKASGPEQWSQQSSAATTANIR